MRMTIDPACGFDMAAALRGENGAYGRVGVSLPLHWLAGEEDKTEMLQLLQHHGVQSVELRTVRPGQEPEAVLRAAELLWENGFQITVHGGVNSVDTAVSDVFAHLAQLLPALRQDKLNITIHPVVGDNAAMLTSLSDHILAHELPVTIALENNRLLPDKTQGDSTALVLAAVKAANRPNVGICFDMGHYAYYVKKNFPESPDLLPDAEFWKYVIHTHIHGVNGLTTHFPLGLYELPLQAFLEKLSYGYFGVYNLELDFPRFEDLHTPVEALDRSIPYLQQSLPLVARLYDAVAKSFDAGFESALTCLDAKENTFSLIHSTSYLFHTAGCRWGMDVAFRWARSLAKTPAQAAGLLKPLQVMVISHSHADHFEKETLRLLAKNDTIFIVPDFLEAQALECGIAPEKLVLAKPGEKICLHGMTFLPFASSHFRPNNGPGVPEYGYHVSAPGCPSQVFPVDIRDFSKKEELPPADYCFANVWLRDESCDESSWRPMVEPWAQYMLQFSTGHILMTHLYEDGRPEDKMWREEHTRALAEAIHRLSPETKVIVPNRGQCIPLV